jgi:hypothetical protein
MAQILVLLLACTASSLLARRRGGVLWIMLAYFVGVEIAAVGSEAVAGILHITELRTSGQLVSGLISELMWSVLLPPLGVWHGRRQARRNLRPVVQEADPCGY